MDALLSAADLKNVDGPDEVTGYGSSVENLLDLTFNIRGQGLNVDYMTYSMLSLANNDHRALLDPDTLARLANKTFSTFFQHYASNNVTFASGGRTFQRLGETLPADIGLSENNRRDLDTPVRSASAANIDVQSSRSVVVLQTSKTAAWICIVILSWLIVTILILAVSAPKLTKSLQQRVETVGDVVALVAVSESLLKAIKGRSYAAVQKDPNLYARLGDCKSEDGNVRYGIELCSSDDVSDHNHQHANYQHVPGTDAISPPLEGQVDNPTVRRKPLPSSFLHSRQSRHVSDFSTHSLSPSRRRADDDGDIALLSLDRSHAYQQHHDLDAQHSQWQGESLNLSAEEYAAIEYMNRPEPR